MVNKEIYIDGVDVSGCNFTLERDGKIKCECCHATGFGVICDCESWKTCDYKNYKRKEQECEELRLGLIEAKAQGDYLNNLALSKTLDTVSGELDQLKEQIKYQQNFIDNLLLATNNSEWLDKSILDDEASEIIEKIEMDYIEFEEGKEINAELKAENATYKKMFEDENVQLALTEIRSGERHLWFNKAEKYKQALTEIKEIAEANKNYLYVLPSYFRAGDSLEFSFEFIKNILNKISECEENDD